MNNICFYQGPPPVRSKKIMNQDDPVESVDTGLSSVDENLWLAQPQDKVPFSTTVQINYPDTVPFQGSPRPLDLKISTEESSSVNVAHTQALIHENVDDTDDNLPTPVKFCADAAPRDNACDPAVINEQLNTIYSKCGNFDCGGKGDGEDKDGGSLRYGSETTMRSLDCPALGHNSQEPILDINSSFEIPETQAETCVEKTGKTKTPAVDYGATQETIGSNEKNAHLHNCMGSARRWSFPGSVAPSVYCGNDSSCLEECRRIRAPDKPWLRPCKKVALQRSTTPTTESYYWEQKGSQKRPTETSVQTFDHKLITQVSSPCKCANEEQSPTHQTPSEAVPLPAALEPISVTDAMPASSPTSSFVSLHPLSPDDTSILTAVVHDATQLTNLSKSVTPWNLPPSLSSETFTIMNIRPLGDQTWLLMAKMSNGATNDATRSPPGRKCSWQRRSQLKRRRRPPPSESDAESEKHSADPTEHHNHPDRRKQARLQLTVSDDSHSETDDESVSSSPPIKMKRGGWTLSEDLRLTRLVEAGTPWSTILKKFPRRREGAVRSHWNSVLKPLAS
ncbi:uncharacterized protein HMPREF1541_09014 [Cyphellophora europaea CBS 101466]|uniref:Uncharacterized protein n=1 Tax=Cyphellophora europaea (strain CBS 101466) TaxID=1220924 RepID=W2RJT2_CYPE1|nr:uncharacterized protein HMPREF1541_09014 [Cyphellophora europaea CBS 101466]ETN36736.1 hypothetical protein HMPREF1541_09014 [Cyphellophora europaea CBS 101466]